MFKRIAKWVLKRVVNEARESADIDVDLIDPGEPGGERILLVKIEIFGVQLLNEKLKI